MNRNLIIPIVLLDAFAVLLVAFGVLAHLQPGMDLVEPIARRGLALPMMVVGGVLMLVCAPLMWRWFIASMKERSR